MALTLLTTIDTDQWYPIHDEFCLCFEDTSFLTSPTPYQATITFSVNPSNGDEFLWYGTTYTFVSGTPATDTEIEIGATLGDTIVNTATVLATHPYTSTLDWFYFPLPAFGTLTIISLCATSQVAISFVTVTAPMTIAVTPAVPAAITPNYSVRVILNILGRDSTVVIPPVSERIDNIYIKPVLELTDSCDYEVSICTDLAPFIRGAIDNDFRQWETTLSGVNQYRYEWVALLWIRYWIDIQGVAELPGSTYPDTISFLNARKSDYNPDWSKYHPSVSYDHKWLVNQPDNLLLCSNTGFHAFHIFLSHDQGGSSSSWRLDYAVTPDVGIPVSGFTAISVIRDCVYQVNLGPGAHVPVPANFSGVVTLVLSEVGGSGYTSETLLINYVSGGGCADKTALCSDSTTTFRYLNKFGVWDILQAGQEQSFGIEVQKEEYIPSRSCGNPNDGVLPYSKNYNETFSCFSREIDFSDEQQRAAIIDFLTSPEVYVDTAIDYAPFGGSQRVVVDFEDFILKQNVKNRYQIPISYKFAATQKVNTK